MTSLGRSLFSARLEALRDSIIRMKAGGFWWMAKVELKMKIDATGNLQEINSFGGTAACWVLAMRLWRIFKDAKFIPAFRDGKPVACDVTLPIFYKAAGF